MGSKGISGRGSLTKQEYSGDNDAMFVDNEVEVDAAAASTSSQLEIRLAAVAEGGATTGRSERLSVVSKSAVSTIRSSSSK